MMPFKNSILIMFSFLTSGFCCLVAVVLMFVSYWNLGYPTNLFLFGTGIICFLVAMLGLYLSSRLSAYLKKKHEYEFDPYAV